MALSIPWCCCRGRFCNRMMTDGPSLKDKPVARDIAMGILLFVLSADCAELMYQWVQFLVLHCSKMRAGNSLDSYTGDSISMPPLSPCWSSTYCSFIRPHLEYASIVCLEPEFKGWNWTSGRICIASVPQVLGHKLWESVIYLQSAILTKASYAGQSVSLKILFKISRGLTDFRDALLQQQTHIVTTPAHHANNVSRLLQLKPGLRYLSV